MIAWAGAGKYTKSVKPEQHRSGRTAPLELLSPDPIGASQTAVLWPDPSDHGDPPLIPPPTGGGNWEVAVDWARIDGRAVPVGLSIRSWTRDTDGTPIALPGGPTELTRELVRSLPFASLVEASRQRAAGWANMADGPGSLLSDDERQAARRHAEQVDQRQRYRQGRPRQHGPEFYATVATLYMEAVRGGGKPARQPAVAVYERLVADPRFNRDFPSEGVTEKVRALRMAEVRKHIQRARRDGLIPPVSKTNKTKGQTK